MFDDLAVENRLNALELKVAELERNQSANSTPSNWLEKFTGSISDEAAFREASKYGRDWRQADRPCESGPHETP